MWSHVTHERSFTMWIKNIILQNGSECKITQFDTGLYSLYTTTFPGRVLPHCVVYEAVIQKWEIVVKRCRPTAGLLGRVPGRKPPVVSEVVKDFVVVGLGLPAGSWAVPEYHFLAGAVAQAEVWHVEVDLFKHTALSSSTASGCSASKICLPASGSCSVSFTALLAPSFLLLPSVTSPDA